VRSGLQRYRCSACHTIFNALDWNAAGTIFFALPNGKKYGMMRAQHKFGIKASKRGLSSEQILVWICCNRKFGTKGG
jgi:transposase-like protein